MFSEKTISKIISWRDKYYEKINSTVVSWSGMRSAYLLEGDDGGSSVGLVKANSKIVSWREMYHEKMNSTIVSWRGMRSILKTAERHG